MAVQAEPRADPPRGLLLREIGRLLMACVVCAAYDVWIKTTIIPDLPLRQEPPLLQLAWLVPLLVFWGESHFYWTHRCLHAVPWLYRHVHKFHHESFNPDPWSGLSFHPIESAIYFSSLFVGPVLPATMWTPMVSLRAPLHVQLQLRRAALLGRALRHKGGGAGLGC